MKIAGCTALVTGGNRGIGEGFVEELLAQDAAKIYVGSRVVADAETVAALDPDRVEVVELDITDQGLVDTAASIASDVTLLVNNAGVFHNETLLGADDMAAMESEITVNYLGTMRMCRAFAPGIAANGGGAIVNVLSAGGIVAVPDMGGYSPSKFAMRAASDCLRAELAPNGVHVAALIVGSVDTRMAEHVVGVHKEPPRAIAKAGLVAAKHSIAEHDTDPFAIGVRAQLHRDPAGLAAALAIGVQQG
ncbi:MAG: SDR family NAD(P)-dependent oxidoreductase [Actinomycetota bacterium]